MSPEKITDVSAAILSSSSNEAEPGQMLNTASSGAVSDEVGEIFQKAAWRVLAGWLLGCFALLASQMASVSLGYGQWIAWDQAVWVSLASGLITLASLVPGLLIGRGVSAERIALSSVAIVSASSAMGIRFAGTVALFVACRYHFGEESSPIVFLVIGWYVFLTSIEVHGLARGCTSLDQIQDFGRRDS